MDEERQISLPLIRIDNETWILLKGVSRAFNFRASSISSPHTVQDPSDHRMMQSRAEGSVKCTSTRSWDISKYTARKKRD
jgi:hypothetical protein